VSSTVSEPRWLPSTVVQAIHADQIKQHGGAFGLRDQGLLDSALQRAPNHWRYNPSVDLLLLAALYAVGLAQNHPFIDGNKRTAFQAMYVFLGLNGLRMSASEMDVVRLMREVASGIIKEDDLASWLKENTQHR
jgi:death-on-curing protein